PATPSAASPLFLFGARLANVDDLAAAVVAARAHVVAQMRLAARRIDGQGRRTERVVRAAHAALRRRLAVLLNGHGWFSSISIQSVLGGRAQWPGAASDSNPRPSVPQSAARACFGANGSETINSSSISCAGCSRFPSS